MTISSNNIHLSVSRIFTIDKNVDAYKILGSLGLRVKIKVVIRKN